jgi:hypothetical protein
MRKKFSKNKTIRVSGTFRNIIYDKNRHPSYVLFLNIKNVEDNKPLSQHINVHASNELLNLNPQRGDIFEFTADIIKYTKYRNSQYEDKKKDYGLNKPRNYKKISFDISSSYNNYEKLLYYKNKLKESEDKQKYVLV